MHPNPAAVAVAQPPVWDDARFRVPLALVGFTILATATFAALHLLFRRRGEEPTSGDRDASGWKFPEAGYVLCPQSRGLEPTAKLIQPGSLIVLVLGSPAAQEVEPVWARVVSIDAVDPNRIGVVLIGQATTTGQRDLQTGRHGFRLAQKIWVTKDCTWDVLRVLDDPGGVLLCGADLRVFDGPDVDVAPDGLAPAQMPASPRDVVGRRVELYLVSKAGRGTAWQVPVIAEVIEVGSSGHVATVKVSAFGRDPEAERPGTGYALSPGQTFDITWDCVLKYL